MPRMKIFSASEEEAFESPPVFTNAERIRFFSLPAALTELAAALRSPSNRIRFLLAAGYFKARHKFFNRRVHPADRDFVAAQLGMSASDLNLGPHYKGTYARHQQLILDCFGFAPFDARAKGRIAEDIKRLAAVKARPRTVLLEAIDALTAKKIEIPTYNLLANLVVAAMEKRQEALSDIVDVCLTESQRQKLDALLSKAPVDGAEDGWRYRLTLLKKPLQSTKPRKIRATLLDQQALQTLYLDLQPVVARINLSYGSIRYYAYSVIKSQIPQVSRRFAASRYLHLIAFVIYQTYKLNDTLVDILLHSVQATLNTVDKELRETFFDDREQRQRSISSLVDSLRQNVRATLSAIKRIVAGDRLTDRQKVRLIDSELNPTDAGPGQLDLEFDTFEKNAAKINEGPDRLAQLAARSLKLQHRVAGIVLQLEFAPNCSKPGLGPKPLFILKYVDDVEFRQAIEKQLNKVESSNKFSKAVSYGHSAEFLQSEKEDQEIAEGCRRLIKNAIICWNYLYLSRELERQPDQAHRDALLHAMRHGSVAAYRHFNLHGEFDFSPERMVDSVGLFSPKDQTRKARKIGKPKKTENRLTR